MPRYASPMILINRAGGKKSCSRSLQIETSLCIERDEQQVSCLHPSPVYSLQLWHSGHTQASECCPSSRSPTSEGRMQTQRPPGDRSLLHSRRASSLRHRGGESRCTSFPAHRSARLANVHTCARRSGRSVALRRRRALFRLHQTEPHGASSWPRGWSRWRPTRTSLWRF